MKTILRNSLIASMAIFFAAAVLPPKKKIKVWLIGDSTMCYYDVSRAPLTGWGMPFVYFFDSSVTIDNRARGGRSTRTFISENRWQPIADSISEGDYVFMQFGHNDEAKEEKYKDRYTPVVDYKNNLIKFITETRAKKGHPIMQLDSMEHPHYPAGQKDNTHFNEYGARLIAELVLQEIQYLKLELAERIVVPAIRK